MRKDEWIKAAMTDDTMVAELLMRLNSNNQYSDESYASPPDKISFALELPLIKWGTRKPRSRQIPPVLRCNINPVHHQHNHHHHHQAKKETELTRGSPTTPLSWSPGSSLSSGDECGGFGDFYEESSRQSNWYSKGRSKVTATIGTSIRRSRKRKTFAELKEEESFLLKEKIHLKKDLVTLRNSYEGRMAINDSLKRIKIDLQSRWIKETGASCDVSNKASPTDQFRNTQGIIDETPSIVGTSGKVYESESYKTETKVTARQDGFFVLPDLNMPFEEDSGASEVLYGLS